MTKITNRNSYIRTELTIKVDIIWDIIYENFNKYEARTSKSQGPTTAPLPLPNGLFFYLANLPQPIFLLYFLHNKYR